MLKSLEIKNVALIDNLSIDFIDGLNVLSGETGAGKSIVIDSLNFVIGAKANKSLIKQGQAFMKVTAVFSAPFSTNVLNLLDEYDIETEEDLIITRKMNVDGKGDIKVNGNSITATMLKNITSHLIDIHGQHEHQRLLKDKYHLQIIDCFVKNEEIFNEYNSNLAILKDIQNQIKKFNGSAENQERMLDLLSYQITEIENAKLKVGEDDELSQKKLLMVNSEKIYDSINSVINELDGQSSLLASIKRAYSMISGIVKFDETMTDIASRLDSAKYELIDIVETLKDKKENCTFNQNEFDEIDERLDKIKLLKKKYGATIDQVLLFLDKSKKDYDDIVNSKDKLQSLLQQKEQLLKKLYSQALSISKVRKDIALTFEKDVKSQLNDLGMKNSKFKVDFCNLPNLEDSENLFKTNGLDDIKFLFSANAGQDLKPLSEIISGGEASRFMLALKNILSSVDNISCMIFDEIDTGISGDMGYKVACKLANISKTCQIMSVSHLPQICAMADCNIKISKHVQDDSTSVKASVLKGKELLEEISRLAGGSNNSIASLNHAQELKNRCEIYKNNI